MPSRYNGSLGDNPQDQNGNNLGGQPTWSANDNYSPQTPDPRDAAYQTPPYQSPTNKGTPSQYHGSYSGVPQGQNGIYPQTPPSTWSRNGSYAPGAPKPQDGHYQMPPYQYNGNCAGSPHGQTGGNLQTPFMLSRNRDYAPATAGPQDISYQMPSYQPPGYNSNASPPGQYYRYGTELAPTVPYDSPQNLPAQTPSGNDRASVGGSEGPYNARLRLNDPQTRQVLFEAVDSGDATLAEQLLRAGADHNMRDSSGLTLLEKAVQNWHLAVVRLLFHYPVDDSIFLAVVEASTCDGKWSDDLVRLLISHGTLGVIHGSGEHSGNRDDQELD